VDFPDNLLKGFMQSLKFSELGEDAVKVRDASERAMLACNTTVAQCKGGLLDDEAVVEAAAGSSGRRLSAVDPADLATIQGSVGNSFTSVNRVASDQYFGVDKLQRVAAPTQTVMDNAQELKGKVECDATAPLYCGIYQASELLVASAADARQAVHDIANRLFSRSKKTLSICVTSTLCHMSS
jgi:hypothetical protein